MSVLTNCPSTRVVSSPEILRIALLTPRFPLLPRGRRGDAPTLASPIVGSRNMASISAEYCGLITRID